MVCVCEKTTLGKLVPGVELRSPQGPLPSEPFCQLGLNFIYMLDGNLLFEELDIN